MVEWQIPNTNQAWYAYDAAGNRTLQRTTIGSTTSVTVYPFGLEEYTYDGSGTLTGSTHYYSLAGHLIGELTGLGTLSTNFFLTDGLGSILGVFSNTAGSASLLSEQLFAPYGVQRTGSGNAFSQYTNKGFTGQYSDSVSGLDYYTSRYYDPVAGVFLSADKKQGNRQGENPYAYVGGNPETKTDPTGQYFAPPPGGNGGPPPSCVQLGTCNSANSAGYGYGSPPPNPCNVNTCSVTLPQGSGTHTFTMSDLHNNPVDRILFLQDFYQEFAPGWGNAEIAFAEFLLKSKRLLLSPYWQSVDFQLIEDQLMAAFDFLNGYTAQNGRVANWLAFMNHPTNNSWWEAHNASILTGDQQARANGLYAKESWTEQHFINEALNVINDIQFLSESDPTTLASNLFSPKNGTTGTLSNIFYPQQYNDTADIESFAKQAATVETAGFVIGGGLGALFGVTEFVLTVTVPI